jgi:acyl-CoA reductase-like NAD-dependent aldehyde dehydrogenase
MKLVSTNPSRNFEIVGEVEVSTEQDVKDAVSRSRAAQLAWGALSQVERNKTFSSFVQVSQRRAEDIANIIAVETGRPIASSRADVSSGIRNMSAYIEMAATSLAPISTVETETEIHRIHHEPRGVIAAICPWNFPFSNLAWQRGQALLAVVICRKE